MTPLATVEEFEIFSGREWASGDEFPELLLRMASGAIRREAQQTISLEEDDVADLAGNWSSHLVLPERPVVAVTSIEIVRGGVSDGIIATSAYQWNAAGDVFDVYGGWWGGAGSIVRVTYTHGFATVPDEIVALCLQLANRLLENPTGVRQETIGSYSYSAGVSAAGAALTEDERRILHDYRGQP